MESTENKVSTISPQKQTVKNRSKSTDEVQQAKKGAHLEPKEVFHCTMTFYSCPAPSSDVAFHTPQKSLPAKAETEKLEETAELNASSEFK